MKYQCEICGAVSSSETAMCEHEKECRAKHDNLFYCTEQLNRLIYLADTFKFGIVAEIPIIQQSTDTKDKKNENDETAAPIKIELKYFTIVNAELDGKKNRCILKVQNDAPTTTTETKASKKK